MDDYIMLFPEEYNRFCTATKNKREAQRTKFAEMKGGDYIVRALYDIPENLDKAFKLLLSDKAQEYMRTKQGARWFARKFVTFRLAEKI